MMIKGDSIFHKLWYFLRTYVLTLQRFDLLLQGAFCILIFVEANVHLLLKRDASEGHHPGLVADYVMLGAAGVELILGAAVAWWGRGRRQLALSFWLVVTAAAGLLVLAFPFAKSDPASVELCGGSTIASFRNTIIVDDNLAARTVFLVITALMCALAKVSIWSHGFTYLDDHEPQNGPAFYGILISIRLSLGLAGSNWLRPTSVSEDWWEAHLSLCMLSLMFACLFTLFPKRMPKSEEMEELGDSGVDTGCIWFLTKVNSSGFGASLGRLVRNKALMMQTLALSFLSAAVFGFVHYDKAYVQARFHIEAIRQDPRTSRALTDIFRSLVIIFFVTIFRVRFSARRPDGVKANTASRVAGVIAILVGVFFTVLAVVSCGTGDIQGLQDEQPTCSQDCRCNSERYGFSPVCTLDTRTTYFSPCNAGCSQYEDLNGFLLFQNCSCGSTGTQRAVRGACTVNSCRLAFSVYQVFYTVMLAVSAACFLMQGMVVVRAVRPGDKVLAVGGCLAGVSLLAFVFGHLAYMLISYLTCAYSANGACLLHSHTIWTACAASAVLSVMAAVASLIASRMPTDIPEITTEL